MLAVEGCAVKRAIQREELQSLLLGLPGASAHRSTHLEGRTPGSVWRWAAWVSSESSPAGMHVAFKCSYWSFLSKKADLLGSPTSRIQVAVAFVTSAHMDFSCPATTVSGTCGDSLQSFSIPELNLDVLNCSLVKNISYKIVCSENLCDSVQLPLVESVVCVLFKVLFRYFSLIVSRIILSLLIYNWTVIYHMHACGVSKSTKQC